MAAADLILAQFRLIEDVMQKHTIFVGGSQNGNPVDIANGRSVVFVDGYPAEPDADGALSTSINATIELYVLDHVESGDGEEVTAYFLAALDDHQRKERVASLHAA